MVYGGVLKTGYVKDQVGQKPSLSSQVGQKPSVSSQVGQRPSGPKTKRIKPGGSKTKCVKDQTCLLTGFWKLKYNKI